MIPGEWGLFEGQKLLPSNCDKFMEGFEGLPVIRRVLMVSDIMSYFVFYVFGVYASLDLVYDWKI